MTTPRRPATLYILLALAAGLQACAGGPIARQVASSLAMQAADKITGDIVDSQLPQEKTVQYNPAVSAAPTDPAMMTFMMARFVPASVAESAPTAPPQAEALPAIRISRLVPVKIYSFIIGDEKAAILSRNNLERTQARIPPAEWEAWQLAEGGIRDTPGTTLLFLVPPDLEKMQSGDTAVVELATGGGLGIARDRL